VLATFPIVLPRIQTVPSIDETLREYAERDACHFYLSDTCGGTINLYVLPTKAIGMMPAFFVHISGVRRWSDLSRHQQKCNCPRSHRYQWSSQQQSGSVVRAVQPLLMFNDEAHSRIDSLRVPTAEIAWSATSRSNGANASRHSTWQFAPRGLGNLHGDASSLNSRSDDNAAIPSAQRGLQRSTPGRSTKHAG
jgi:hypothetical protein